MPSNKKLLQAAAGSAGGGALYAEDVFSTYVYDAAHGTSPIVNGINLADDGGMVWFKNRTSAYSNVLFDTERGISNHLVSNTTAGNSTSIGLSSFNTDGFSFSGVNLNVNSESHVAWTFRKAEKFFDIQEYTGTGVARTIAHNLGSVPGCMIIKRTDLGSANWFVYHIGIATPQGYEILLNTTANADTNSNVWNNTAPTDSVFSIGAGGSPYDWNASGGTYIAYLFASDAGGFGDDEDENIIKCGSYVGNISSPPVINLGFEPQWILFKAATGTYTWTVFDVMRGWGASGLTNDAKLHPNTSAAESLDAWMNVTSTGFQPEGGDSSSNGNGVTYIYMAIRRPMKTPTAGTEVFAMDTLGSTGDANQPGYRSPFPVDMGLKTALTGNQRQISTRLLQGTELLTESTAAEAASSSKQFDYMNGTDTSTATSSVNMMWMFKRAAGFMDVVAYEWNGTATRDVVHGLTVAPELYIVKRRNSSSLGWYAWHSAFAGTNSSIVLNTTAAKATTGIFTTSDPTSSTFPVANDGSVNASGGTYITYLFATLAGISKVGSYTGTGADLNVSCGFTAGARFILIKRSDSAGDWYVWDSLRGISAGNDPYFFLNDTAAEVTGTDYVDPLNAGFTVTSNASSTVNVNGGTYIFLAIA
jgi:hypothetical protein